MPHSRSSQDSCARDAAYRIHTPANYVTFVRILLVPVWLALAEFQMSIAPFSLNPYLAACINIDIPIQHCSETILKRMGRKGSAPELHKLFAHLRAEIPNICLLYTSDAADE